MSEIKLKDPQTGEISYEDPPAKGILIWLYKDSIISKLARALLAYIPFLSWGYALIQKSSFSRSKIRPFIKKYNVNEVEFLGETGTFKSFADFFERRLKPEARPIDSKPTAMVSPVDGRLVKIDLDKNFDVKERQLTLEELVKDPAIANRFKGGTALRIRLAPQDYHRVHAPFDGTVKEIRLINGPLYSVSPIALKDHICILQENKRVLIDFDDFAMVLVGATFVGTIHLEPNLQPKATVKKGEEIAHFSFGGSMCVLLLKSNFSFDSKLDFPKGEVLMKMGQPIAHLRSS